MILFDELDLLLKPVDPAQLPMCLPQLGLPLFFVVSFLFFCFLVEVEDLLYRPNFAKESFISLALRLLFALVLPQANDLLFSLIFLDLEAKFVDSFEQDGLLLL